MNTKALLAIVTLGCAAFGTMPEAQAKSRHRHHHHRHHAHVRVSHCAPYKISTREIDRCRHRRTSYDRYGHCHHYTVTVVTYRSYYSDGSRRTYTRSFRS